MDLLSSQRWNAAGNKRADFCVNSLCKRVRIHTTHPLAWIEHPLYFQGSGVGLSDVVEVVRFATDAGKTWFLEYREYFVEKVEPPLTTVLLIREVSRPVVTEVAMGGALRAERYAPNPAALNGWRVVDEAGNVVATRLTEDAARLMAGETLAEAETAA